MRGAQKMSSVPLVDERGGLRERKKQDTRSALSWAATRLAVERGLDNVRVEDIAAEARVSPRTFNNYFASKGEAIAAPHYDRVRLIAAELRSRPAGEPLWEAVTAAVLAQFPMDRSENVPDQRWIAGVRLMTAEPALQSEFLRANAAAETDCAIAIAERTGTDAVRDLYPRLVASAVGAALGVAVQQWLRADPPGPMAPVLRDALGQLAAGLPTPHQ